jgi:dTDP-glucose 4,6-dehydratase
MQWRGTQVLVTGAGGFIGSHLVEGLVRAHARVRALVHYNSRNDWGQLDLLAEETRSAMDVIAGDLRDPFALRRAVRGCDVVFHLGALIAIPYSYSAPESFLTTNAFGTLCLLQACLDEGVERIIHTSTSEVYGSAQYIPMDEKHPLQAQSPYAASKIAADKIAESFYCSYDLPVVIVRPFNAYGPRQSARAVIPTILAQALASRPLQLGSLEPVRDFTYVSDTVDGFLAAGVAEGVVGEVVNVGSGIGVTIRGVVSLVEGVVGHSLEVTQDKARVRPERSEVTRLVCDNRKAHELLGWGPRVGLAEGLRRTADWIRQHPDLYRPGIYNV